MIEQTSPTTQTYAYLPAAKARALREDDAITLSNQRTWAKVHSMSEAEFEAMRNRAITMFDCTYLKGKTRADAMKHPAIRAAVLMYGSKDED